MEKDSGALREKANRLPDFTEIMGSFINDDIIMSRRLSDGGCTTEILGPQGTGKTSLMLTYASMIMDQNPEEILIWRDSYRSPCQFNRVKSWEIFAEEKTDLVFRELYTGEPINIPVTYFKDFHQLEKMVSPQQLNVVYVSDSIVGYIRLINHFRRAKGWYSMFFDEYEDIAPLNCHGIHHRIVGALGREMKNIRKGLVSLFCNTQSKSQIDWRVRSSFMVEAYLSGAKRDKHSSVYQEAINGLEKGACWLSWEGKFGRIEYPAFEPDPLVFEADDVSKVSELDQLLKRYEKDGL